MSRITIRFKMMLWYTALTSFLLVIFIPVLYQSIYVSLYNNQESVLRVALSQITAEMEIDNNSVLYNKGVQLPRNIYGIIVNSQGKVVYRNNNRLGCTQGPDAHF